MRKVRDQLNREVTIPEKPGKIVSLVPSQTELLVDLGLKNIIVGVTKFCVHPEGLRKEKKVVGGTKQVHYEKIRELNPGVILCNKEENTKEMVLELEKIAAVHVSDVKNIQDALELIGQYGELFSVEKKALEVKKAIELQLNNFRSFIENQPKRKVAYLIWKEPWMAVGKDTFIDYLLSLNNFVNVFQDEKSRYPEIEIFSLKGKEVDAVLLSTEPFPFKEKHKEELEGLLLGQKVIIVDGEYFSWYGSRLIQAFRYFKEVHLSLQIS